ncbi:60S ribosomal protein L35, L29 [Coemansia sp. RSA 2703]|nr:60S ribosomal protein L35, L29 [Coemansia sp. RSA 2703]KAJ2368198.1 60S ribosomal protein L35, L29 [Coemansia sp. RSA 2607]
MVKVKVTDLRAKSQAELTQVLDQYKQDLMDLKVKQVASGSDVNGAKIRDTRRNIARVLTVITQQARDEVRAQYAGKKYIPKDLRAKKTRALRRALTAEELSRTTVRQQKKNALFARRQYAIKA